MNRPIARLFVLVCVLFALLVAWTSRWTVFEAEALRDNALNRRELLEEQRIRRGAIRARDGTLLARSVRGPRPGRHARRYPRAGCSRTRRLLVHHASGAPASSSRATTTLTGERDDVAIAVRPARGRASARATSVRTTLDPTAQRVALEALRGRRGRGRRARAADRPRARHGVRRRRSTRTRCATRGR